MSPFCKFAVLASLLLFTGCMVSSFDFEPSGPNREVETLLKGAAIKAEPNIKQGARLAEWVLNHTGLFAERGVTPSLIVTHYSYSMSIPGVECGAQMFTMLTLGIIPAWCDAYRGLSFCLKSTVTEQCFGTQDLPGTRKGELTDRLKGELVQGWIALPLLFSSKWHWRSETSDESYLAKQLLLREPAKVRALFSGR